VAKYETYYPGEVIDWFTYDSYNYVHPGFFGTKVQVLEDGKTNPDRTAAWIEIEVLNRNNQPTGQRRWTYKRFFRRSNPLIAYQADQETDDDDLL